MQIDEFMERIKLPREAREQVKREMITGEEYAEWKGYFYQDKGCFLTKWEKRQDKFIWALEFFVRLSIEVYEEYQERQIPDKVFDETFYDITIWCEECYRKYRIYGIEEVGWLAESVKMNLFRLGRLQFEPMILEEDMAGENQTIKAGTPVLNVHIPTGEPLGYESCLDSLRQAEEFFGGKYQAYVCESWLLAPSLREILPEDSNILRFQNLFEVVKMHHTYPQAEQRIFGEVKPDKRYYPEDTQLQKRAKEYLLNGKDLGIGIGFVIK